MIHASNEGFGGDFFEKTQQNADFLKSQRPYTPGGYAAWGGSRPPLGDDIAPMTTLGVGRHQTECGFRPEPRFQAFFSSRPLNFRPVEKKGRENPGYFRQEVDLADP